MKKINGGSSTAQKTDLGQYGIQVIANPNVTKPTPGYSREAVQEYGEKTFAVGYDNGYAVAGAMSLVYMRRQRLLALISNVLMLLESNEGLPQGWAANRLKNVFKKRDERPSMHDSLKDAIYDFYAALNDVKHNFPDLPSREYAHEGDEWLILLGNKLGDPVRRLVESNADADEWKAADELREIYISTGEKAAQRLEDMNQRAPKFGRNSEPTPVIKYVLQQTKELQKIHHLPSAGAAMEAMMSELRKREDVQRWQQLKPSIERHKFQDTLDAQSLQVQIFDRHDGLNTADLGEKLRQYKKDNPKYK